MTALPGTDCAAVSSAFPWSETVCSLPLGRSGAANLATVQSARASGAAAGAGAGAAASGGGTAWWWCSWCWRFWCVCGLWVLDCGGGGGGGGGSLSPTARVRKSSLLQFQRCLGGASVAVALLMVVAAQAQLPAALGRPPDVQAAPAAAAAAYGYGGADGGCGHSGWSGAAGGGSGLEDGEEGEGPVASPRTLFDFIDEATTAAPKGQGGGGGGGGGGRRRKGKKKKR